MTEDMPIQYPEPISRSFPAQLRGMTTCIICKAVYAPSQWNKSLWEAPPTALESTFISMCHFCFRCRRPSCPNCWDGVHQVCGACVQDTNLSFRLATPTLGSAPSVSSPVQSVPAPLVCIRPGYLPGATISVDLLPTRPERVPKKDTRRQREGFKAVKRGSRVSPSPLSAKSNAVGKQRRGKQSNRRIRHLPTLFFLLIFAVILLIFFNKNVSSNANDFIAKILLLDIRVGIAYFWQIIGSIH